MTGARDSLWPRVSELPLVVEGYELERLNADPSSNFARVTTQIRLLGATKNGVGEDISPFVEEHEALLDAGRSLPLAGKWTLEEFCDHLATLEQ